MIFIKSFDYEEFYDYLKTDAKKDLALLDFFKTKNYSGENADLNDYLFQIDNIFNQLVSFYLKDRDGKDRHLVFCPTSGGSSNFT